MTKESTKWVGPGGQAVPTQVQPLGNGQFRAEFVPRVVGEHRVNVSVNGIPTAGSPYAAKVYDVQAIKVKEANTGIVGKPVTFLGLHNFLYAHELIAIM